MSYLWNPHTHKLDYYSADGEHFHDGDTLQLDGINSDGGAFPFTVTGDITISGGQLGVGMNPGDYDFAAKSPTAFTKVYAEGTAAGTGDGAGFFCVNTKTGGETGALLAGTASVIFEFSSTGSFAIQTDSAANILGNPGNGTEVFRVQSDGDIDTRGRFWTQASYNATGFQLLTSGGSVQLLSCLGIHLDDSFGTATKGQIKTTNEPLAFAPGATNKAYIDTSGNLLIGLATAPTSMTAGFAMFNGTAPTANVTNGFSLCSQGGMAQFRDGTGGIITLGQGVIFGANENGNFRWYQDGTTLKAQYKTGGNWVDTGFDITYTP